MKSIKPFERPIYVTQSLLPPIEEVSRCVSSIWESRQLTNNGPVSIELEKELSKYLNVKFLSLFSNGTSALQIACRVLDLKGEVITTPFTFAATTHALANSNITPVFCDIEEENFNIDPNKIEELITHNTTGILPVHVFGNPCDTVKIEEIAARYNLKVIYDAAHAFGVSISRKPIGGFGDISMFSFHATKIFHTIEGGALSFKDPILKERADSLKNFGIRNENLVSEPGLNAKMNELQAGIGMLVLKQVDEEIGRRRGLTLLYRSLLKDVEGVTTGSDLNGVKHNYPYFAICIDKDIFGISRDVLSEKLKDYNIFARKYFYPLCSNFPCYRNNPSALGCNLPVATKVAESVLVLPLYGKLTNDDIEKICLIIRSFKK